MIFQLPIPVAINKMAPSNIQKVDVSPTDPGINPQNMEDMSYVVGRPWAASASGVACENPSGIPAIHTLSPEIMEEEEGTG